MPFEAILMRGSAEAILRGYSDEGSSGGGPIQCTHDEDVDVGA